ncbi:MAG: hypothetical protein K6E11_02625 [Bacilli bacterium]|nr:hypothetical protein [Bacilli bacterium]
MGKVEKTNILDKPVFRLILKILSIVIAALTLLFSALTIVEINNTSYDQAPKYLIWIFMLA